jgi:hypothetical protein
VSAATFTNHKGHALRQRALQAPTSILRCQNAFKEHDTFLRSMEFGVIPAHTITSTILRRLWSRVVYHAVNELSMVVLLALRVT